MEFTEKIEDITKSIEQNFELYFDRKDKFLPEDIYKIIYDSIVSLPINLHEEDIKSIIRIAITKFITNIAESVNLEEIRSKNEKEKEKKKKQIASLYLFLKNITKFEITNICDRIYEKSHLNKPKNLKEAFNSRSIRNYEEVLRIVDNGFGKLSAALKKISEKLNEDEQKLFLNDIFLQRKDNKNNILRLHNIKEDRIIIIKLIESFYSNIQKGFGKLVEHLFFETIKENGYILKYENNSSYTNTHTEQYIINLKSSFKIISQYKQFLEMNLASFDNLKEVYEELDKVNDAKYNKGEDLDSLYISINDFVKECFDNSVNKETIKKSFEEFIKNIESIEKLNQNEFNYTLEKKSENDSDLDRTHLNNASEITNIKFDKTVIIPNSSSEIFDCYLSCSVTYKDLNNEIQEDKINKFIGLDVKFYNGVKYKKKSSLINIIDNPNKIEVTAASPLKISTNSPETCVISMFKISSKSRLKTDSKLSKDLLRLNFKRSLYEDLSKISSDKKILINCDFGYKTISRFLLDDRKIGTLTKSVIPIDKKCKIKTKVDTTFDTNTLVAYLVNMIKINDDTKFNDIFNLTEIFTMFLPKSRKTITYSTINDEQKTIIRDPEHMCKAFHNASTRLESNALLKKIKEIEKPPNYKYAFFKRSLYLKLFLDYLVSEDSNNYSKDSLKSFIDNYTTKSLFLNESNFKFASFNKLVLNIKANLTEENLNLFIRICKDIVLFFKNSDSELEKIKSNLSSIDKDEFLFNLFKENYVLNLREKYLSGKQNIKLDSEVYKQKVEVFINSIISNDDTTQSDDLISQIDDQSTDEVQFQ